MSSFIQNIIWNAVEGFVDAGTRSAGEFAGNAVIKAGDVLENGGRGIGNSIEKKAQSYGSSISGQACESSTKTLTSTTRKLAVERSRSLPPPSRLETNGLKDTSSAPRGLKKYPGSNQAKETTGATKNVTVGSVERAQRKARGTTEEATKDSKQMPGSVVRGAPNVLVKAHSTAPGPAPMLATNRALRKPYPSGNTALKPYATRSSGGAKVAVKPGVLKPFVPPVAQKKAAISKPRS